MQNYINMNSSSALKDISSNLTSMLVDIKRQSRHICFVCIGTDRSTGDSLCPLVGHKLSGVKCYDGITIYGSLEKPVHAKNLDNTNASKAKKFVDLKIQTEETTITYEVLDISTSMYNNKGAMN